MSDIATRKLFENDRVVMWELALEQGESSGLHTHQRDYVFQVLSGSTLETTDKQGVSLGDIDLDTGSTHYLTLDGNELIYGEARLPATHEVRNVGPNRYYEILVELK